MFSCRMCSGAPFSTLFGTPPPPEPARPTEKKNKKKSRSSNTNDESDASSPLSSVRREDSSRGSEDGESDVTIVRRSSEQLKHISNQWALYVHPRARELWPRPKDIKLLLLSIAEGIRKRDDPILGDESECVIWHGAYAPVRDISSSSSSSSRRRKSSNSIPIVPMVFPTNRSKEKREVEERGEKEGGGNEDENSDRHKRKKEYTHVNRLLVFLYADESSFMELQAKQHQALVMACGESRCVNLQHISLDSF